MSSGRKRTADRNYSAEDQALDQISKEAEERIQARRQARAEAREIRLKEIERQQREEEERQKAQQQGVDSTKSVSSYSGSRRGSNDSTESDVSSKDSNDPKEKVRLLKAQLHELEDKYKAAVVTNAQLDNVKTSHVFQLELLKEQLEEQEEAMIETQREYKDKCREFDFLKRDFDNLKLDNEALKHQMEVKDKLLKESGLVIVSTEEGQFALTKCANMEDVQIGEIGTAIISEEAADMLKKAGEGTLGNPGSDVNVICPDIQKEAMLDSDADICTDVCRSNENEGVDSLDKEKTDIISSVDKTVCVNDSSDRQEICSNNQESKVNITENVNTNDIQIDRDENENLRNVDIGNYSNKKGANSDDESEVFYESKSEFSPLDKELVESMSESKEDQGTKGEEECEERVKSIVDIEVTEDPDVTTEADESSAENVVLRNEIASMSRKPGHFSLDVRRILGSESCISMESDVTYHSESEDIELFEDPIDDDALDKAVESKLLHEKNFGFEALDVDRNNSVSDSHVDADLDQFNGLRISQEVDFTQISSEVGVPDQLVSVEHEESILNVEAFEDREQNVLKETVVGHLTDVDRKESKTTIEQNDASKLEHDDSENETLPSLAKTDEVFMPLPLKELGLEQNMLDFVRNYVTDVVLKSVNLYNKEIAKDKVTVRKQSYTMEPVDISVAKQHYSEELMDTASSVFCQRLSSGSVEILSPIVTVPSETKGELKFFSYKVDTDADVVLTAIEEEKTGLEGLVSVAPLSSDCVQSPVSGFGIYYSGATDHSVVDSDVESDIDDQNVDIGNDIEFSAMPVWLEVKTEVHVDSKVELEGTNEETLEQVAVKVDVVSKWGTGDDLVDIDIKSELIAENMGGTEDIVDEDIKSQTKAESTAEAGSIDDVVKTSEPIAESQAETEGMIPKPDYSHDLELTKTDNDVYDIKSGLDNNSQECTVDEIRANETGSTVAGCSQENIAMTDKKELVGESTFEVGSNSGTVDGVNTPVSRVSGSFSAENEAEGSVDTDSLGRKKSKKKSTKHKSKEEHTKHKTKEEKKEKKSTQEEKKNPKEDCVVS